MFHSLCAVSLMAMLAAPLAVAQTLMIGARYDTMDPEEMKRMAGLVKRGRYLDCTNGSHLALYDDQEIYFRGVIDFIRDVDAGPF